MKFIKKTIIILTIIIFGGVATAFYRDDPRNFEITKNLDIFYTVFKEINTYYVDEIDPGKSIKKAITSMLSNLDPYTVFYSESQIEEFKFMTTGEYGGIGAIVLRRKNKVVVVEVYQNSPADKAGMKAGDEIFSIDKVNVSGKTLDEISELLKGKDNSLVNIIVKRYGKRENERLQVQRSKINISPVPFYQAVDSIGYIRFSSFTDKSAKIFKDALVDLVNNKHIKSLIIDVRGNPGGLLNQAIQIVNYFIPKGQKVVETRGKVKQWNAVYRTQNNPIAPDLPIAVLVNGNSASASEILAGTLQDRDRAVIIGNRTYGKGLVQTTRKLIYNTHIKITTAKYYIPSGRCIQALDYTHRDNNGNVKNFSDSLISKFKTSNGRVVYDGKGIKPDIFSDTLGLSKTISELLQDYYIFDFATIFASKTKNIANPENFDLNQSIIDEFYSYLNDKGYKIRSNELKLIDSLKILTKNDKNKKDLNYELAKIETMLSSNTKMLNDNDFSMLKRYITLELIGRYYYQTGRFEYNLFHDSSIDTAKYILKNAQYYQNILQGRQGEHLK